MMECTISIKALRLIEEKKPLLYENIEHYSFMRHNNIYSLRLWIKGNIFPFYAIFHQNKHNGDIYLIDFTSENI